MWNSRKEQRNLQHNVRFFKMGINFKVLFYTTISLIIVSCNSYNKHSYNNGTGNKFIITGEQYPYKHKSKKLEKISIFTNMCTSYGSFMSNDIIGRSESGECIDTVELADKNSKLFTDLQTLLATSKIDSTLLVGPARTDSIYDLILVKNDTSGYIITSRIKNHTILTTSPIYEEVKHGIFKDIAPGETSVKKIHILTGFLPGENDIEADDMILYQYRDGVPNDTICYGTTNTVRINSYIAEVDSALFEDVTDRIRELIIE